MSIIERMKKQHSAKFREFVTSHLSMCLNLENDMLAEIIENQSFETNESKTTFLGLKKPKTTNKLFGSCLTRQHITRIMPLITYLHQPRNLAVKFVFEPKRSVERQQHLREQLDGCEFLEHVVRYFTAHDCAAVLKEFLGELPEPLLTTKHFNAYSQIADLSDESKQLRSLQLLVQLLPADNFNLLRHLMCLLSAVDKTPENLMDAKDLAIVLAPHLAMPKTFTIDEQRMTAGYLARAVEVMIKNADALFEYPAELVADITQYLQMLDEAASSAFKLPQTSNACDSTLKTQSRFSRFCKRIKKEDNGEEDDKVDNEIVISSSVFFADRQASTEAAITINTSTALADLHSYILAMPESAHKRKLISRMMTPTTSNEAETTESSKRNVSKSIRKMFGRKGRDSKIADSASNNLGSCLSPSVRHRCSVSCIGPCVHGTAPVDRLLLSPAGTDRVQRRVTFAEEESVPSVVEVERSLSIDDMYFDESDSDNSLDINDFEWEDSDKENQE